MRLTIQSKKIYTRLQKQYSKKINLSLNRVNVALKKLGYPNKKIKNPINFIGSDGKFTTLRSLQYFIEGDKKKVSTFTSPHLYDVRHRFWLKDHFISIKELKKNIKNIKKIKVQLTLFEVLTLAYYISASKLKNTAYALVEAGLMFAGDSTRVWDRPRCQIITNINKQHLEWVKPKTIREICYQKVGFLSNKSNIYVGKQEKKTMQIIKKLLEKNNSKKFFYGSDWKILRKNKKIYYKDKNNKILIKTNKIHSDGILDNLGIAIKVARDLNISKRVIQKTIPKINFEGRLQYINKGKLRKFLYPKEKLLLDGCHSSTSAKNLANYLKTLNGKIYGIWGMQKNKNPENFIKYFKNIFSKIRVVKIPNENNSCNTKQLLEIAINNRIACKKSTSLKKSLIDLSDTKPKTIVVFGSFYLVGKFLNLNY